MKRLLCFLNSHQMCKYCVLRLLGNGGGDLVVQPSSAEEDCYFCLGAYSKLSEFAEKAVDKMQQHEGESFSVNSELPVGTLFREEEFISRFNLVPRRSLKTDLNIRLSEAIAQITGLKRNQVNPDLQVYVSFSKRKVKVVASPIFIRGRYLKLARGLPQAKWPYKKSKSGVEHGGHVLFDTSVEELVSTPLIEMTKASRAKFHGMGREDIDVRMLGTGRPFVVELINPKFRRIDLCEAEKRINKYGKGMVEVHDLCFSSKNEVRLLKALSPRMLKTYRAVITADSGLSNEELLGLSNFFSNITIRQRTPIRVLGRRSDRVRIKKVYNIKLRRLSDKEAELVVTCDGGLYVKELIDGDGGRTTPSISEVLGRPVVCRELDVLEVLEPALTSSGAAYGKEKSWDEKED